MAGKPGTRWKHRISNVNTETGVADCLSCGPGVQVYLRSLTQPERGWSCATADKIARVRREYGMELEDLEQMLIDQNGLCAICEEELEKPHVDHDHTTGEVRGLLCNTCNRAIGLLKDDTDVLLRAVIYLERKIHANPRA